MIKRFFVIFIFLSFFSSCKNIKSSSLNEKTRQKTIENVKRISESSFICSFDGISHDFIIDFPKQMESSKKIPLVIMLPGYSNTADYMRFTVGFHQQANIRGYAVVYVTGSVSKYEKTGGIGWNSGIAMNGNSDVEFLVAFTKYLQNKYEFDKNRTFIAGFSNGGFMVHRLAMESGKTFRAFVCVAGKMPEKIWKNRNKKNRISFFQITGEKDAVVPKKSDGSFNNSRDPAIEDVIDYWAKSNELNSICIENVGQGSVLSKWTSKKNRRQVWHLFVKDSYHFWPTQDINCIDANSLILDFFDSIGD